MKEIIVEIRFEEHTIDELAHAICMGIRKGLFGGDAKDYESILNINKKKYEL